MKPPTLPRRRRPRMTVGLQEDPMPTLNASAVDSARLALYDEAKRRVFDVEITSYTSGITSFSAAFSASRRFDRVWFSNLLAPSDCKMQLASALKDAILAQGQNIDIAFLSALAAGDVDTVNSVLLPIKQ